MKVKDLRDLLDTFDNEAEIGMIDDFGVLHPFNEYDFYSREHVALSDGSSWRSSLARGKRLPKAVGISCVDPHYDPD